MIRIFKLVVLLVISQVAFGQAPSNYTNINGRYRWIAGMFDSTFHIPKGSTPSLRTGGSTNSGGLFYNTSDSSVYTYTGTQWIKLRGSINPSDTTNKYVTQVYKKSGSDSIFYVKGGVHTWAFNDSTGSPGGGGGGKVYYFNGGVSMGTFGGFTMYELGDTANTGAAANFTRSTTGNIANFITDPNKPGLLQIPAGVWSVDAWLSETGGGANHAEIYVKVEKWNGTSISTIATSPIEEITEGGTPNLYTWSVSIPTTSLAVTDRIILQFYIQNTNGKTVTLYTQNGYVGEVHTTFTTGIGAINGLTAPAQYLVTGTSGTDFNINSATATHTFNLPTASSMIRGALSPTDWSAFNNKIGPSDTASMLSPYLRSNVAAATYVLLTRTITINGTSQDLSANRTYNVGTVTSVATNTGTGITGGTITTTGTLAIDTLLISTRAWRQKGIDSVAALINSNVSGTTNYISKFTSSSAIGNSQIFDNGTNVGIGTASPSNKLDVNGVVRAFGSGNTGRFYAQDTNVGGAGVELNPQFGAGLPILQSIGSYPLLFGISGSERMRLDASGNLGLGTSVIPTTSVAHLKVNSNAFLTDNGLTSLSHNAYWNSGWFYNATAAASLYQMDGASHLWYSKASGTAGTAVGFTERMRLDASGNLGLGVTPSAWASGWKALQIGKTTSIADNDFGDVYLLANAYYDGSSTRYIATGFNATYYGQENGAHIWLTAPSGTAGNAISFTQAMTLDASGRLGIGVTNPSGLLQLNGSIATSGDAATFTIKQSSTTYTNGIYLERGGERNGYYMYIGGGLDALTFRRNYFGTQSDVMSLTRDGNVGIGTTSPSTRLDVNGVGTFQTGFQVVNGGTGLSYAASRLMGQMESANLFRMYITGQDASTKGGLEIYNATSTGSPTIGLAITASSNVGIGTTSPGSKLSVIGSADFAYFYDNSTTDLQFQAVSSATIVGTTTSTPLAFKTSNTERMRITSGGELLINTTSDAGDYKLQVAGNTLIKNAASGPILDVNNNNNTSGDAGIISRLGSNANNTSSYLFIGETGGVNRFFLYGNGTYATVSDVRLKTNIQKVNNTYLDKLLNLEIVNYNWLNSSDVQLGVIAQQVEKYIPEIIVENKDNNGIDYKSIQVSTLPYILIKAIQEQQTQIEQLKAELQLIKNK